MRGKCNLSLEFCTSEEGFSFDELILSLDNLFKSPDGIARIASVIVSLIQEVLVGRQFKKQHLPHLKCCDRQCLHIHDIRSRTYMTSVGKVKLFLTRVRCSHCGKTQLLVGNWLHFPAPYARKSNELEKIVIDAVTDTSYRRASVQIATKHLPQIPKSTMHDWLLRTDCDELNFDARKQSEPMQVFADGTYVKGGGEKGKAVKRDLKIALGVDRHNQILPIGTYTDKTWQEIAEEWRSQQVSFPSGSVLIADGEVGLADSLAAYVDETQRCQWHIDHDMYHVCRMDGKLNAFSSPIRKQLRSIMGIELPAEDYEPVRDEQKACIEERLKTAEEKVDSLVASLNASGCSRAATYLERAKCGMFGYVRRWLRFGIACPKASSMIERVMRELGRRLKRIAYGWSARGAAKMARIILKKFTQQEEWDAYWKEKTKTLIPHFFIRFDGRLRVTSEELTKC